MKTLKEVLVVLVIVVTVLCVTLLDDHKEVVTVISTQGNVITVETQEGEQYTVYGFTDSTKLVAYFDRQKIVGFEPIEE